MKVHVTIERDDDDHTSLGITADGFDRQEITALLIAGAEMVVYEVVTADLLANGGNEIEVAYAAPLRTRLLMMEQLVAQPMTPYSWVELDLASQEP